VEIRDPADLTTPGMIDDRGSVDPETNGLWVALLSGAATGLLGGVVGLLAQALTSTPMTTNLIARLIVFSPPKSTVLWALTRRGPAA
jgi:hypothetical protein